MKIHGVGVNFGVYSSVVSVNGLFQTREHSYKAESERIKDAGETTVSKVYWDAVEEASFTYVSYQPFYLFADAHVDVPSGYSSLFNNYNAALGQWIQVVDTRYPAIAGFWLVDEVTTQASNTSAVRVTLKISRHPYVQRI